MKLFSFPCRQLHVNVSFTSKIYNGRQLYQPAYQAAYSLLGEPAVATSSTMGEHQIDGKELLPHELADVLKDRLAIHIVE